MTQLNQVTLIGRLTRDPELTYTGAGTALCKLGVAVSLGYGDKEKTGFFDVTIWAKTAEFVGQHFTKGKEILIEGSLDFDQWEDKNGGGKRSKVSIKAFKCGFVGSKSDQGGEYKPYEKSADENRLDQSEESKKEAIESELTSDDIPF